MTKENDEKRDDDFVAVMIDAFGTGVAIGLRLHEAIAPGDSSARTELGAALTADHGHALPEKIKEEKLERGRRMVVEDLMSEIEQLKKDAARLTKDLSEARRMTENLRVEHKQTLGRVAERLNDLIRENAGLKLLSGVYKKVAASQWVLQVPRESLFAALRDVQVERDRQDQQWGGADRDDEHSIADWIGLIEEEIVRMKANGHDSYLQGLGESAFVSEQSSRLIKIAALAVAAHEALTRRANRLAQ